MNRAVTFVLGQRPETPLDTYWRVTVPAPLPASAVNEETQYVRVVRESVTDEIPHCLRRL